MSPNKPTFLIIGSAKCGTTALASILGAHPDCCMSELRAEMSHADALILPMGFGADCAQIERTSFKTKFLDYLAYQKPIVVWGPQYCSAVRVAREFNSAEICAEPTATAALARILTLKASPERQGELVRNARQMYEDRFHPDKIHNGLVTKIRETLQAFRN